MRALLSRELRTLPRHWPLWTLLPAAAIAGWGTLPANADLYRTHLNVDPQGAEQFLDNYRFDAFAVYTSGLGWAQLLAMFAGAYLVLTDPRLHAAQTSEHGGSGSVFGAKAAAAALYGLLLAVIALATAWPTAHSHLADHNALALLRQDGGTVDELSLADPSVWLVVACAVVTVALAGVLGVGLAGIFGRWPLIWVILGVLVFNGLLFMLDSEGVEGFAVLSYVFAVPALPWVLLWYAMLDGWAPGVVVVCMVLSAGAALLGLLATRRRLAKRAREQTGSS
jgi:hypothetical protein